MVHRSSVPLYWRLKKAKYRMVGSACSGCKETFFPPKILCPNCGRTGKLEEQELSGKGIILSHTVIRIPPDGFERHVPYTVAIVRLDEGPNISGQVIGSPDSIKKGSRVRAVFRKIYEDGPDGLIHYGLKFELVD